MSAERNSGKFSDRVLLLGEGDQVVLTRSRLFNYAPPFFVQNLNEENVKEPVRDSVR